MSMALAYFAQPLDFNSIEQFAIAHSAVGRLLLACLLGALIGFERQWHTRNFGIRTNLLICMGSAFFTLLSAVIAGESGNRGQVASNIVQGIGFLGAGLIIHNRSRIHGLASAAMVWSVASIGMACGAGLYGAATAATVIVIIAMEAVGFFEYQTNLKTYNLTYEARGSDQASMMQSILDAMDKAGERLAGVETNSIGGLQRVVFPLNTVRRQHQRVRQSLAAQPAISKLFTFSEPEDN